MRPVGVLLVLVTHVSCFSVAPPTRRRSLVRMVEETSKVGTDWQQTAEPPLTGVVAPTPRVNTLDPVAAAFSRLFPGGSDRQIFFGVLQRRVDLSSVPSAEERARRQQVAAAELVNIDADERDRRQLAGTVLAVLTAALAAGLLASHVSPLTRAAIAPPLFLSYGFLASAKTGLWNIGQGGVWDVDGSGLQSIEDATLAARLREKVNSFNIQSFQVVGVLTILFVTLPELF